jgi:predicted nucleotidyltransferase component of viral defense system
MIHPDQLKNYYPEYLWSDVNHRKFIIKEYLQLLILDYLTTTPFIRNIVFIGGTCLRLTKGIDRFSEDLDFDCKHLSATDFMRMTDGIVEFLKRNGYHVEIRDKENVKLQAFRRNIHFPGLLFDLGLSGYRQERFLIKIESQDQGINYPHQMGLIRGCGLFFRFPVPTDEVLCAMKISALLSRKKGRDFYDVMFLLSQTKPDYDFLQKKCGIDNITGLKRAFAEVLDKADLNHKSRDFEHLVFSPMSIRKILHFSEFVGQL